jgi:glycine oxidase
MGVRAGVSKDRVIVVGAGLVGMATALELDARGLPVTLLEKAVPGAEASTAAAGILGPQLEHATDGPTLDLTLEGARATRALVARLRADVDADVDWVDAAAVKLAFSPEEVAELEGRAAWQRARGLRIDVVTGDEARRRDASLGPHALAAAFLPDDQALDPRRYGAALQAAVKKRAGIEVRSGVPVRDLLVVDGACSGVALEDGSELLGAHVVVCGGAWSTQVPGVAAALGVASDFVRPVRGQMIELRGPPGTITRVVYGPGGYLVPRRDGRVVCGSTMEEAGFDKSVTVAGAQGILERARRFVPAVGDFALVSTWAGLRPAPHDGLPLLGPTKTRGLWLSTGHFRNGVLLAAVSASALAALLVGDRPPVDVARFTPERLG